MLAVIHCSYLPTQRHPKNKKASPRVFGSQARRVVTMLGSEIVTGLKIDCWLLPADRFPASALLSLSWIGLQHGCASLLLQDAALSYPTIGPLSRWVLPANRLPWEGYGNIACFKLTPFYHTLRQFVNHKVY